MATRFVELSVLCLWSHYCTWVMMYIIYLVQYFVHTLTVHGILSYQNITHV